MSESMIERVARAIYDSEGNQTKDPGGSWRPSRLEDDENKELYFDYARAAIEAMREPTEQMREDGHIYAGEDCGPCFTAMIDAALNEQVAG